MLIANTYVTFRLTVVRRYCVPRARPLAHTAPWAVCSYGNQADISSRLSCSQKRADQN